MQLTSALSASAFGLILALAACSSSPDTSASNTGAASESAAVPSAAPDAGKPAAAAASPLPAAAKVIGLEGLGDLRIGQPAPKNGAWSERGAQIGDACRTITSPDYPGVYAIVQDGKVQRITVGQRSDVKLVEGIGIGASEQDVKKWFASFREEPHKYLTAPAKYLTAPNAASGDPALRFEIGRSGKVDLIHVGQMPVLGYVEACG